MHDRSRLGRLALIVGLAVATAGCSDGDVPTEPNPIPACAPVIAALPETVLGAERAGLPSGGEPVDAVWGSPTITFACGHEALGPTSDPCITVDGIDWVYQDLGDARFTTYGTDPAVEVNVPKSYGRENATGALVDLAAAVAKLPKNGRACIG